MRKLTSALLASCLITAPLLAHGTPAPAPTPTSVPAPAKPPITSTEGYLNAGAAELARLEADTPNNRTARNVIIFIGDGMSVTTLTAARIFEGQQKGVDGESYVAQMDRLPHTALVKTYSHDGQVPDSAPTATAIVSGTESTTFKDFPLDKLAGDFSVKTVAPAGARSPFGIDVSTCTNTN